MESRPGAAGPPRERRRQRRTRPSVSQPIRALWTHNFAPERPNSLVFVDIAADGMRACGVDVHLEYLGNLRSPTGLAAARKRVAAMTKGFDLVHAQYGSACALATAGAEGLPKVVSVRGNDYVYPGEPGEGVETLGKVWTGVGPFVHNDPRDRPPSVFGGNVTLHAGPNRQAHLLLPVIPKK